MTSHFRVLSRQRWQNPLLFRNPLCSRFCSTSLQTSSSSLPTPSSETPAPATTNKATLPVAPGTAAFTRIGVCDELVEGITNLGISQPTLIQTQAIPEILSRRNVMVASHTGSGKTLAYVLPIIQMLRDDERNLTSPVNCRPRRPRALVVLPTRELCYQVHEVAKHLSHYARVRVAMLTGGPKQTKKKLEQPIDLLIVTPGTLKTYLSKQHNRLELSDVQYVVADEADTLYARSRRLDKEAPRRQHYDMGTTEFEEEMRDLLFPITERCEKAKQNTMIKTCQFIFASASLPSTVSGRIIDEFPDVKRVATRSLHKVPPLLKQVFIRVGAANKLELLESILERKPETAYQKPSEVPSMLALAPLRPEQAARVSDHIPLMLDDTIQEKSVVAPTIIFTNTVAACRAASLFLAGRGYNVACYHGAMPPDRRAESFNAFVRGERNIMVATDLGSRGLDTSMVPHVIMMDFPRTVQDYLHRAGRTARGGTKGMVTCFVRGKDLNLARGLETTASLDLRISRKKYISPTALRPKLKTPGKKRQKRWFELPGHPKKARPPATGVRWMPPPSTIKPWSPRLTKTSAKSKE